MDNIDDKKWQNEISKRTPFRWQKAKKSKILKEKVESKIDK